MFDDQTAEAAAALLQIRGSPRASHVPFIPDVCHSFLSASPVSATENSFPRLNSILGDSRFYVPVETKRDPYLGSSSLRHPTELVPSSVPIISAPSPQRKRKRSLGAEPIQEESNSLTSKGKGVDHTLSNEGLPKRQSVLENDGVVRCICELQVDDGFTIQCESCQVWQHAACMRIHPKTVPQVYLCEQCNPRFVDGVRARRSLLSRLQAKNASNQGQEKKKQSRRTSSEATPKQGKTLVSASMSPQPQQTQQPTSRHQSRTFITSPVQPHAPLQFDSQSHNPYPAINSMKNEVLSPVTPLIPIIDSSPSTLSMFDHTLPVRQPKGVLHTLYPRLDNSQLSQCQLCTGRDIKCDHKLPPLLTLHSANTTPEDHSHWSQRSFPPNTVLRPFVCGKRSVHHGSASASKPQENAIYNQQNEKSYIKFGIFALREIKAGEEIILSCEWEDTKVLGEHCTRFFRSPGPSYADSASSILSHFPICSCGSLTDSCISSHYHRSPSDPPPPGNGFREEAIHVPQNKQLLPPAPEGPENKPIRRKKNKTSTSTTKVSVSRKSGPASIRRRGAASGKRKSASNKEAKDIDIIQDADQDVDIDAKSEDLNVGPTLESSTDALAMLSIHGTPEQHLSHQTELVTEAVSKLSTNSKPPSENSAPASAAPVKDRRSRAPSVTNTMLEATVAHSPPPSVVKPPISASVLSPLLPSSTANANPAVHVISSVASEVTNIPVLSLSPVEKDPLPIMEETKKVPIKRTSLVDWKISKDKEKQALKDAQEKVVKQQGTEPNVATSIQRFVEVGAKAETTNVGHPKSLDISLSREPSIDVDENAAGNALFDESVGARISLLSSTERMESGVMKLKVEANDDYNAEARPFTSPQVPSCSLHADSSSDPRHTPPCPPSSIIDDRRSPFGTSFEEGEILSASSTFQGEAQPSIKHYCSSSQSQEASRHSRSISPSYSPPTRPRSRSYHRDLHRPPPPRLSSDFTTISRGRSIPDGPSPRNCPSRPIPNAPRALRGEAPPRHPSFFSSSYRPSNYHPRDYDRYRGPTSLSSTSRFHDSPPPSNNNTRPWRDPPWKR